MEKFFYGIDAKLYHLSKFAKSCLNEYGFQAKEARKISKLGVNIIKYFKKSTKGYIFNKINLEEFDAFISYIIGIYFTTLSHHEAIQILSLSGHGLNSMMILRSQLETLLILLYIIEPNDDLEEVFRRIDYYIDYVKVKMKQNMDKSSSCQFYNYKCDNNHKESIINNYEEVFSKYINNNKFKILERRSSFPINKKRLTEKYKIRELYDCIFAQSSASIHIVDIGDRMQRIDDIRMVGFEHKIRHGKGCLWPLMISNLIQYYSIFHFAKFFGIDHILRPKLLKIFGAPMINES